MLPRDGAGWPYRRPAVRQKENPTWKWEQNDPSVGSNCETGLREQPKADRANPLGSQELLRFYLLLFLTFFNLFGSPRGGLGFTASPKRDFVMSNAAWQKKKKVINSGRVSMNFVKGSKYFR